MEKWQNQKTTQPIHYMNVMCYTCICMKKDGAPKEANGRIFSERHLGTTK